jgi:hypothetical protein
MIVCHPFESTDENRYPARLALAVGDAEMRGIAGGDRPIEFADSRRETAVQVSVTHPPFYLASLAMRRSTRL